MTKCLHRKTNGAVPNANLVEPVQDNQWDLQGKKLLNYNKILSCFKITLHSGVLSDEANDVQSCGIIVALSGCP